MILYGSFEGVFEGLLCCSITVNIICIALQIFQLANTFRIAHPKLALVFALDYHVKTNVRTDAYADVAYMQNMFYMFPNKQCIDVVVHYHVLLVDDEVPGDI